MIQIAANPEGGYLINGDREAMATLIDGMAYALEQGSWEAVTLGPHGAMPLRIKVSDEPELVGG